MTSVIILEYGLTKSTNINVELSNEGLLMFTELEQTIASFVEVERRSCKRKDSELLVD